MAVVQAILLSTFSVLPGFLIGAVAVGMRADLGFGPAQLGLGVAWFFMTTAFGTAALGKVVEQLGVRLSLTVGALGSAASLLIVGLSPAYAFVLIGMTVGGLANALAQPAINALLSQRIPSNRLGFAFGIKQASAPAAMLLGGLAVPTLSMTVGWRGAFVVGAALAAIGSVVAWVLGEAGGMRLQRRPRLRDTQADLSSLIIFAVGGMLGAAAGTSLSAFLVDSAVTGGMGEARAGLLFAVTSMCGLISRPLFGVYIDRYPNRSRYSTIVLLLFSGIPGYLMLASGMPALYFIGGLVAFVAGWGWTGLFHYTVVSQNPATPASSTGVIQTGLSMGAGGGPLVLGAVAEFGSYQLAWVGSSILAALGGACFWYGRSRYRRLLSAAAIPTDAPRFSPPVRWSDQDAVRLSDEVREQQVEADGRRVTLIAIAPNGRWRSRGTPEAGLILVMEGHELDLKLGVSRHRPMPGDALHLPPNLIWTLRNDSDANALLAVVRGSSGDPGAAGG